MGYTYNETEYELKPLTLGVKSAVVEIFNERNRLLKEATSTVNIRKIENAQNSIARLRNKIEQKRELGEDVDSLLATVTNMEADYANDTELQAEIRYYEAQLQSVMLGLMYNEELMNRIIPKLLDKPVKLDFANLETEKFVFAVINDFFLRISGN